LDALPKGIGWLVYPIVNSHSRAAHLENCIQPDVCKTKSSRHLPCGLKKIEAFRMQSMLSQCKPGNKRAEELHLGITVALKLSVVPKDENKQQVISDSKENKQRIITWPPGMPIWNLLSRISPKACHR